MQIISGLIGLAMMAFSVVVAWRAMKALESIAESTSKMADKPQ